MRKIFIILSSVLLLQSCLERNFTESEKVLVVDYAVKHIICDSPYGQGLLADTLMVTANRSWSAVVENGSEWLSLDTAGHQNFSNVTETASLPMHISDNTGKASRSGRIAVYSEGSPVYVEIEQDGWTPKIGVSTPLSEFDGISAEGQIIALDIVSNTDWTLKNDPNDEASLSFSQTSGNRSATVLVAVAPNTDRTAGKTATISISAQGCRTIDIAVKQNKEEAGL